MEDEWARGDKWSEVWGLRQKHCGIECWQYVNGAASVSTCTPGKRDANNVGVTPEQFLERVNKHVRERKASAGQAATADDLLVLDEVRAVRLYTGPAYQPINMWLRRVGKLESPESRRAAALDPKASYGATVGWLVSAIRKLAAANTAEENGRTLYRGLKGRLATSFWLGDKSGLVCATDAAFMSTSTSEKTPLEYMDTAPRPNLLWEIEGAAEDEVGYHCGADVAMLSQFEGEREVLFPPLTMLRVKQRHGALDDPKGLLDSALPDDAPAADHVSRSRQALQVTSERRVQELVRRTDEGAEEGGEGVRVVEKEFERVAVVPTFTG